MSKLLTIAIPTYNLGQYLRDNVNQIATTECFDLIDVLIVDDGSTDDTAQIADALSHEYPNSVRCIHKENGHYGSAVNAAINMAKGLYFKIVDADDKVNSIGLEALIVAINGCGNADIIVSDYAEINNETASRIVKYDLPKNSTIAFNGDAYGPFAMHAVSYKTSLLQENRIVLDEGVAYTDVEYVVYPSPYLYTIYYLPQVVYLYTLGREGQSVEIAQMTKNLDQHMRVLRSLLDWYRNQDFPTTNGSREYSCRRIASMYNSQVVFSMLSSNSAAMKAELLILHQEISKMPEIYSHCLKNRDCRIMEKTNFRAYRVLSFLHRLKKRI